MPSPLVEKLLDKNFSEQSLLEFEEDFRPSSEGLWNKAKEIAESKFGFPSSKGLDYAIKWFNLKEGYWITYLTDEELEEFFQMEDDDLTEGTLHHWFKGSKSKDGKAGWVQADGSPCANEKGETKTPKCFSSGRLASLKRKGKKGEGLIKSAVRRKREEDPGQQSKSGGAKPTNVKTFAKGKKDKDYVKAEPKLKKEEVEIQEKKDQKSSGSGTKDACYHKVKARYSVWPSAYASGALVKCRKKGAANWGNSTKKEEVEHVDEACWKGYEKKGMKTMFGKKYPNCVKKEETETVSERDRVFKALEEAKGKRNCDKDPYITYDGEEEVSESIGGAGTLIRQGVKLGGKKGGRVVQKGTTVATAKGKQMATSAKQGNQSKLVGDGNSEKRGASIGGTLGAIGGALIPDGPAMVAGEIGGGIVGSKIGGKIGRQFDKRAQAKRQNRELNTESSSNEVMDEELGNGIGGGITGAVLNTVLKGAQTVLKNPLVRKASTASTVARPLALKSDSTKKSNNFIGPVREETIDESTRIPSQNGNVYMVTFTWKGKFMVMKVFFPEVKRPSKSQVQDALNKVYPGCVVKRYDMTDIQPGETHLNIGMGEETEIEEDMSGMSQKSGDKRSTDSGAGMTSKGVAKYNRRTGGNLKTAVTTPPSKLKPGSKAAGRRKSFCARSRSWKGERGLAARRRWNC